MLVVTLAACGSSGGLAPSPGAITFGDEALAVGMRLYVGFTDLPVVGSDDVRLTAVRVTGVPAGLTVVKTGVVSVPETSGTAHRHYIGALTEDMLSQGYPNLHIHPASEAVLKPAGAPVDWYVVVVIAANRSGDFTTGGLHLSFRTAGGDTGDVDYRYHIHIHTAP